MNQPLWKTVWRFLRKLKIELSYDPKTTLLGIYLSSKILILKSASAQVDERRTKEGGPQPSLRGRLEFISHLSVFEAAETCDREA